MMPPERGSSGRTSESVRPTITAGMAKQTPAQGPAAPISNSADRLAGGDFIRMNAPKVPTKNGGPGMKYGRLAQTPWMRART